MKLVLSESMISGPSLVNTKFGQHDFFPEPKVTLTKELVYFLFDDTFCLKEAYNDIVYHKDIKQFLLTSFRVTSFQLSN